MKMPVALLEKLSKFSFLCIVLILNTVAMLQQRQHICRIAVPFHQMTEVLKNRSRDLSFCG